MAYKVNKEKIVKIILFSIVILFFSICFTRKTVSASDKFPYYIKVNKGQNTITIYEKDDKGKYTVPVKAMTCSVGVATPLGVYKTPIKYRWKLLMDDVWGQYSTRIVGGILFHSVWYYKMDASTLSATQYNKLGTTASHGCVRLTVIDAKWIYDNCPIGTTVEIYESKEVGPLGKPETIKLKTGTGWDPTDPSDKNPFKNKKPAIKGASNKRIEMGTKIDLKKGVTATSTTGFDITKKITITGEVDMSKVGKYKVTYYVEDEIFRSAKKTITITVTKPSAPPYFEGVEDKYITNDVVVDKEYALQGVKAFYTVNEIDKDKIKVIIKKDGNSKYLITYAVTAPNGLTTKKEVVFTMDRSGPILFGVEHKELTFEQWLSSKEDIKKLALEGVSVTDDSSKLATKDIVVTITDKDNYSYIVTYEVMDKAGNLTSETVEFIYFSNTRIDGVMNVYDLPYGTKITKDFVLTYVSATDSNGNDCTDKINVRINKYENEVYKVTYQIMNDEDELISISCTFTVNLK
jgi:hypothetical protein